MTQKTIATPVVDSSEPTSENGAVIGHDIFKDPALTKALTEDPLFSYLQVWWKQILVVAVAIFAVFFAREKFAETYETRMGEASLLFSSITLRMDLLLQNEKKLIELKSKTNTKKEEIEAQEKQVAVVKKEISEALNALSDTPAPYGKLAALYKQVLETKQGVYTEAANGISTLDTITINQDKLITQVDSFIPEVKILAATRALLDQPEKEAIARTALKALVEKSNFVAASAVYTLVRSAVTPEQKAEANQVLRGFYARFPEQADAVKKAIHGAE